MAAYGFTACAFILPLALGVLGKIGPGAAGKQVGQLVEALALAWVVQFFVFRKQPKQTRRLYVWNVIGALLLLWSIYANVSLSQKGTQFDSDIQASQEKMVAIAKRLNTLDLASILDPDHLTNADALQSSQRTLQEYVHLIDERDQIFARVRTGMEAYDQAEFVDADGRPAKWKDSMERVVRSGKLLGDLGRAQREYAAAIDGMLSVAQRNLGKISVQDGHLVFSDEKSSDQFTALVFRVQAAAAKVETASRQVRQR
jgi:hypothetical protein